MDIRLGADTGGLVVVPRRKYMSLSICFTGVKISVSNLNSYLVNYCYLKPIF